MGLESAEEGGVRQRRRGGGGVLVEVGVALHIVCTVCVRDN